jgi:hypothetical protein
MIQAAYLAVEFQFYLLVKSCTAYAQFHPIDTLHSGPLGSFKGPFTFAKVLGENVSDYPCDCTTPLALATFGHATRHDVNTMVPNLRLATEVAKAG